MGAACFFLAVQEISKDVLWGGVVLSRGSGPLEGCCETPWERLAGSIVGRVFPKTRGPGRWFFWQYFGARCGANPAHSSLRPTSIEA